MTQITFEVDDEQLLPRGDWVILVKARAGWKCERCGATAPVEGNGRNRRFHAHHKNHDDIDNRLANGECLCGSCHAEHHRRTKCSFRDPELQRELNSRVSREARSKGGRASAAAHPQLRAELAVALTAHHVGMTPEERSAKARKGWETRRALSGDTRCRNGHPRTVENTKITPDGGLRCLDCSREYSREWHRRKRQAAKERQATNG